MPSLKFAIYAAALDQDAREATRLSRELGFAGLQFDAYGSLLRLPDLSGTGQREFVNVLTAQDQQLVSLRAEAGPKGFSPGADVDRLIDGLDAAMAAARGLRTPLICVDLGPLPEPVKAAKPKAKVTREQAGLILLPESIEPAKEEPVYTSPPPDPKFVSQVDAALGEIGARADRYGVVLALRCELSSFAALDDALRRAHCPWFGVDLDPVAMLRDEWPVEEIFSRLAGQVRHVRAHDATKGADRRTKPAVIGSGDTNWGEFLENLDAAGYAGWVTIDPTELPDRRAAATRGLKYLRTFVEARG